MKNYLLALKVREKINDKIGIAISYNNIGVFYDDHHNYPEALKNYFSALKIREEIGDKDGIASTYGNIGLLNLKLKKFEDSRKYLNSELVLAQSIGTKEWIKSAYFCLSELDSSSGNFKSAYENYKMFIIYRDSLNNEENTKKTVQAQMNYEFDKKETQAKAEQDKKDAIAQAERRKQEIILYSVIGGLGVVLLFALFIYRSLIQIRKKNILITEQKKKIEEKQKEILDSIRYAARIQKCILPSEKYIVQNLARLQAKRKK